MKEKQILDFIEHHRDGNGFIRPPYAVGDRIINEWLPLTRLLDTVVNKAKQQERERIMKIFASFGKVQLKKPLSGKEFEALFDE